MPSKRAFMYSVKAVTCRASSRTWLDAYSTAPGSTRIWHRLVESESALEAVTRSAKSSNETVRTAATKVLGDWQSEKAAYVLLGIVKLSSDSEERRRALKSFSGLVRRLGFPRDERIGVCKQAMELCKTDDERRIVLHTLAGIPAPETLALLEKYLADPGLREDASKATITICERLIRSRRRGVVAKSMKAVLEATEDEETKKRAESLLRQAGGRQ